MLKATAFRIVTPLLALLATAVVLEGGLRVGGWWIESARTLSDPKLTFTPDEYRIVALGESTTAPFRSEGRDRSWPAQLERILNESHLGKTVHVVNLGVFGSSTPFLLEHLRRQLSLIRPQLVVSMMGINDIYSYEYLHSDSWFWSLRLVKVVRRFFNVDAEPFLPPPSSAREVVAQPIDATVEEIRALAAGARFSDAETKVTWLAIQYPSDREYIYLTAGTVFSMKGALLGKQARTQIITTERQQTLDLAFKYLRMAYELNPANPEVANQLAHFGLTSNRRDEAQRLIADALSKGLVLSDKALTTLGAYGTGNNPAIQAVFRKRGIVGSSDMNQYRRTIANYRSLARLLAERKIGYIAMQYPTGSVTALENIFSDIPAADIRYFGEAMYREYPAVSVLPEFRDIVFASNENFNEVVTRANQSSYFRDHFANPYRRFGHTTPLGYELIAKNLSRVIMDHWAELDPKR